MLSQCTGWGMQCGDGGGLWSRHSAITKSSTTHTCTVVDEDCVLSRGVEFDKMVPCTDMI